MRVAIVIPEIGFDEDPMSPVIRDDTVATKKPITFFLPERYFSTSPAFLASTSSTTASTAPTQASPTQASASTVTGQ